MFGEDFKTVVDAERLSTANANRGNYIHGAVYPPYYPAHLLVIAAGLPGAGGPVPHPFAGEPDMVGLVYAVATEWRNQHEIGLIKWIAHRASARRSMQR